MLSNKIIFWYALLHDFYVRLCPNLITTSLTQFNKGGRGTKELKPLRILSLKIQEVTSKKFAITEKKRKILQPHHKYQPGTLAYRINPCLLTLQMNQSFTVLLQL